MGATSSKLYRYSTTISAIAFATCLYYYIFYGVPFGLRHIESGRKKSGIVGLKNFGNTCYFNACIQALAACNLFCTWIERRNLLNAVTKVKKLNFDGKDEDGLSNGTSKNQLPFPVIAALHQAFTLINAKADIREQCLSEKIPSDLIRELTVHNLKAVKAKRMGRFILNSREEQDTHEAFNFILDTLADEGSNLSKVYHSSSNMALSQDPACVEEEEEESTEEGQVPDESFLKLTTKLSKPTRDPANESEKTLFEASVLQEGEVECDEEEERLPSTSAFCKLGKTKGSATSTKLKSRLDDNEDSKTKILGKTLSGQIKGKSSNKEWFGGSIVSRTEVHEVEIVQDTLMAQHITFDGTLGVKLVCMACHRQNPTTLDKFNTLTVTLPRDKFLKIPITLEDLMLHSLKPIQVHDVQCDGCSAKFGVSANVPKRTSSFVKYTAIGRMPLSLCVHISRTEWTNDGNCLKRNEFVKFPIYLDLSKFKRVSDLMNQYPNRYSVPCYGEISQMIDPKSNELNANNTKYILKAVVCHSGGSADSGHFTTYRQAFDVKSIGEGWYFISDCQISPVTLSQVLSSTAYMLFYEKKTTILY